jgi:hypothetical protein
MVMDPNKPGWSNAPAPGADPFKRNPDGTVPEDAIVPPDPSHVASARGEATSDEGGKAAAPAKRTDKK